MKIPEKTMKNHEKHMKNDEDMMRNGLNHLKKWLKSWRFDVRSPCLQQAKGLAPFVARRVGAHGHVKGFHRSFGGLEEPHGALPTCFEALSRRFWTGAGREALRRQLITRRPELWWLVSSSSAWPTSRFQ